MGGGSRKWDGTAGTRSSDSALELCAFCSVLFLFSELQINVLELLIFTDVSFYRELSWKGVYGKARTMAVLVYE